MGKKVKKQQPTNSTENQTQPSTLTPPLKINKTDFKHAIKSKFAKKDKQCLQKQSNFTKRLQQGSITEVFDESKFSCAICLQILVRPVIMECGHTFCQQCLQLSMMPDIRCSLCRANQQSASFIPATFAQEFINQVLISRSSGFFDYLTRVVDAKRWMAERRLTNFDQFTYIDFHTPLKFWTRALICKTQNTEDGKLMLHITYRCQGIMINEVIESTSRRLAPAKFFTSQYYSIQQRQAENQQNSIQPADLPRQEGSRNEEIGLVLANQREEIQMEEQAEESRIDNMLNLFNWEMNNQDSIFQY